MRLDLPEALAQVAAALGPVAATAAAPQPLEPAKIDQALRHYAKGRDAAAANRHLVAIHELERARAIDPASPDVLRQLARSYLAMGNVVKAAALYEELVRFEADDSEARFTIGLAAASRRRFDESAAHLALPRLEGRGFAHDPAADLVADYHLAEALGHLGYDRAAVDLSRRLVAQLERGWSGATGYARLVERIEQRRSEIWQSIGDAHCRLGEYAAALEAYARSVPLAADAEPLRLRVAYANLCLGRVHAASLEAFRALRDENPCGEQAIRLCTYLASVVHDPGPLAEAVRALVAQRPDDADLVRAAALLLPRGDATPLLQEFLERRPQDMDVFGQLVGWLLPRDPQAAVALTVRLAAAHPRRAERYVDRLILAAPTPGLLRQGIEGAPGEPAVVAMLRSRLLASMGALGPAWDVAAQARGAWPDSPLAVRQQIDLAARLREPQLLEQAAASADTLDLQAWLVCSRAWRALGEPDAALDAAQHAAAHAPADAEVLIELAEARADAGLAAEEPERRDGLLGGSIAAAEEALRIDPRNDAAYALLLRVSGAAMVGARHPSGTLPQATPQRQAQHQELRQRVLRENPEGRLVRRLDAQEDLLRNRQESALEKLLPLCASDPSDSESLALAMTAWLQLGRADEAAAWLEERLGQRPFDAVLLSEWASVQTGRHRYAEVAQRLEEVLEQEPGHDAARLLLEQVYRRLDRDAEALRCAEAVLLSRPQGMRRELELAAAYSAAGRADDALWRLRWVLAPQRATTGTSPAELAPTFEQLLAGLALAGRLADEGHGDDELVVRFSETIADRFPDAPLPAYGNGLRSLGRLGRLDERFDALAAVAAARARGASGPGVEAADGWRQMAQALVDAGLPQAGARALRVRLRAEPPLEPRGMALLLLSALAADAAADRAEDSIELVRWVAEGGHPAGLSALLAEHLDVSEGKLITELYIQVSGLYTMLGHDLGACRILAEALALEAGHAMALNNLGYTRIEMGDDDPQTAEWIERAFEREPQDANVLDTMGWLRYKRGELTDEGERSGALRLIEQSVASAAEPSPEVLDHLGDTRWRLGDAQGAREAWRQVVDLLGDPRRREELLQVYAVFQAGRWGLVVAPADRLYERSEGAVLHRARAKLQAAEQGSPPPVAATFADLKNDDGRP
jgi:predicted Zn-dependent protease